MTRRIITAEDVGAMDSETRLVIDDQTTLTAPARELARRRAIVLIEGPDAEREAAAESSEAPVSMSATTPVSGEARRIIVTAVGVNRVGILSEVTAAIGQLGGDILDLSQRITGGYFNAILVVDIAGSGHLFADFRRSLQQLGEASDYVVTSIDERIFSAMHRL